MAIKLNNEADFDKIESVFMKAIKRGIDHGRGGINWDAISGTEAECAKNMKHWVSDSMSVVKTELSEKLQVNMDSRAVVNYFEVSAVCFIQRYLPGREWRMAEAEKQIKKVLNTDLKQLLKEIKENERNARKSVQESKKAERASKRAAKQQRSSQRKPRSDIGKPRRRKNEANSCIVNGLHPTIDSECLC